jgi:hypothetical protein
MRFGARSFFFDGAQREIGTVPIAQQGSENRNTTANLNALLQQQNILRTMAINAALHKQDIINTVSVNAALAKAIASATSLSSLLQKTVNKAASADSLLQKNRATLSAANAALLKAMSLSAQANGLALKPSIPLTAALDGVVIAFTFGEVRNLVKPASNRNLRVKPKDKNVTVAAADLPRAGKQHGLVHATKQDFSKP